MVPPMTTSHLFLLFFRPGSVVSIVLVLLCSSFPMAAAELVVKKAFDIPAGNAAVALKQFAQQSGLELLYSTVEIKGTTTHAVKGRYQPLAALEKMLRGTDLIATQGEQSGAIAVRRVPDPNAPRTAQAKASDRPRNPAEPNQPSDPPHTTMKSRNKLAFLFGWLAATSTQAQTLETDKRATEDADKAYEMSAFKVTSTQDRGYVVTNSGSALRAQQDLLDIPQSVQILTRDFIQDTGANDTAMVLQFAGAQARESGEFFTFRGQGLGYALIDGMADRTPYMDNVFVDSYAVVKGPAAVFYPNTTLGGVVLKETRKPMMEKRNTVAVRIQDTGLLRGEVDSTGPVGSIGSTKVSYRVTAAYQDGDTYWNNVEDKRAVFHSGLKFDYKNTTLVLSFDKQEITRPANPTAIITPSGDIFTGRSRDDKGIVPPGSMETFDHVGFRAMFIQTFSVNWDARLIAGLNNYTRVGSVVLPVYGANFQTRQIGLFNRLNNAEYEDYSLVAEINGKYRLFNRKNQSTFGLILNNSRTLNRFWVNNNFGGTNQPQLWVSMDNYDADSIVPLPKSAYTRPANPGSRAVSYYGNAFLQQIVEVIPDRLSLIAGASLYLNDTRSEPNFSVVPLTANVTNSFLDLHRFGLVATLTKNVRLYALDSTTSLPPSSQRTADGSLLDPASGKGKEIGLKMSFLEGRIFGNLGVFDYTTKGGSGGFGGLLPNGEGYVLVGGERRSKGWDLDLALKVTNNWQVMANYFKAGGSTDDKGNAVPDSAKYTASFFTRYNLPKMRISFGGGANLTTGRGVNATGITFPTGQPAPSRIAVKDGVMTTAFVNYTHNKHLSFSLSVVNVLDENYAYGWQAANLADPAPPRSFSLTGTYRF